MTAYDWCVLTEGADELEPADEPESEEVVPAVAPVAPLSSLDPSSPTLELPSICAASARRIDSARFASLVGS